MQLHKSDSNRKSRPFGRFFLRMKKAAAVYNCGSFLIRDKKNYSSPMATTCFLL